MRMKNLIFIRKNLRSSWSAARGAIWTGAVRTSMSGLDPSGGFIDYVRSKKIPVFQTLDELKAAGSQNFDAIIHYYVFEHIRHPLDFIKQYMELLKDGGLMIFEVPCATDPLVELYKVPAFDEFYWSVAHHWYFTRDSLGKVLKKAGVAFELYPDQRYDISNHMTWMLDRPVK